MRPNMLAAALLALSVPGAVPARAQSHAPAALALALQDGPPAASRPQDPADGLYRSAREALSKGSYARAASLFHEIVQRYPRSAYAPDALYWEAFALYRQGGSEPLRTALSRLEQQRASYPSASTRGDAKTLATRIRGALAQLGDADAAEAVTRAAAAAGKAGKASKIGKAGGAECAGTEDEVRTAALNALLQMNAEQAVPILKQVLARRDSCSASLREKAVFLLTQKRTPETEDLLLSVARQDPDPNVRKRAVFWLSQVPTEHAVDVLSGILRSSNDKGVRESAIFALSQHPSPRAAEMLHSLAEQGSLPEALREKAIFWIGQRPSAQSAEFLRTLYGKLRSEKLKEKVLFSLSQMQGQGNGDWLLGVANRAGEPMALRKKALFWAGQSGIGADRLGALYDRSDSQPLRQQIIFALSQQNDPAAMTKLISIARSERDPALRKKAIFWLGQSKDPRATRVIQEILNQ